MGKLSGGTGEIAISIRVGRAGSPNAAGGRLFLVEFLVGFFVVVYLGFTAFMRTRLPGRVIERAAQ